jgi:hypothetical protein
MSQRSTFFLAIQAKDDAGLLVDTSDIRECLTRSRTSSNVMAPMRSTRATWRRASARVRCSRRRRAVGGAEPLATATGALAASAANDARVTPSAEAYPAAPLLIGQHLPSAPSPLDAPTPAAAAGAAAEPSSPVAADALELPPPSAPLPAAVTWRWRLTPARTRRRPRPVRRRSARRPLARTLIFDSSI